MPVLRNKDNERSRHGNVLRSEMNVRTIFAGLSINVFDPLGSLGRRTDERSNTVFASFENENVIMSCMFSALHSENISFQDDNDPITTTRLKRKPCPGSSLKVSEEERLEHVSIDPPPC
jgi:hypothetical protein